MVTQESKNPSGVGHAGVGRGGGRAGVGKTSRTGRKSGKRKYKVPLIVGIVVLVVGVLAAAGLIAYAQFMGSINDELLSELPVEERQAIAEELAPPPVTYTEPFYMLLVGSDARAGEASLGKRSDTNVLARIDASTATVTLVSIPRDTRVELDGYGTNKFNAAYAYGGLALTIKEANQLCGVSISHYAEINFEKLIELVDVIGGVEVDVPSRINDPQAGSVVIQPGLQTLNGEAALTFVRSRAFADGDYTRTSNQRLLIKGIIQKMMSLPIGEIPGAVQSAAKCVTTDMSAETLLDLALQFRGAGNLTMYSAIIPSTTSTIGGVSYILYDKVNLPEMMKLVDAGKDPESYTKLTPDYGYVSSSGTGSGGAPPADSGAAGSKDDTDTAPSGTGTPPPDTAVGENPGTGSGEAPGGETDGETGGGTGGDAGNGTGGGADPDPGTVGGGDPDPDAGAGTDAEAGAEGS